MEKILRKGLLSSSVMLVLLAVFGFTACSNVGDESVIATPPQSESVTVMELKAYNDSLLATATRREIQSDDKTLIALADGAGALGGAAAGAKVGSYFGHSFFGMIGGALIGGAYASYKVYHDIRHESEGQVRSVPSHYLDSPYLYAACYVVEKDKVEADDYKRGESCGLDSCAAYVGILHNKILDRVEKIDKDEIESIIDTGLSEVERNIIDAEEYQEAFRNGASGLDAVCKTVAKESAEIMQLFSSALKNVDLNDEMLRVITNKYTSTVKDSKSLTEDDKSCLYAAFAVTCYSYQYWTEKSVESPFVEEW